MDWKFASPLPPPIYMLIDWVKLFSHVWLFATPWTVASQAPPSMGFSRQTGVGCHFLLQGIFLTQGLNLDLPHCRQMLYRLSHQGRSLKEKFKTVETSSYMPCRSKLPLGERGPRGKGGLETSSWPAATKEMGTTVLNSQSNEFCQQPEGTCKRTLSLRWDYFPTQSLHFSCRRPWAEDTDNSCPDSRFVDIIR